MNDWLVLADSEVAEVAEVVGTGCGVRIRLSAAHVWRQPDGDEGRPTPGYARGVELKVMGAGPVASLEAGAGPWLGRLAHGRLLHEGEWRSKLPLPGVLSGPVRLELVLPHDVQLLLAGDGLSCAFTDGANFTESLAC